MELDRHLAGVLGMGENHPPHTGGRSATTTLPPTQEKRLDTVVSINNPLIND